MKCFVYGLIDPVDLSVRYIGLTTVGMVRPRAHWRHQCNDDMRTWISGLKASGLRYEIAVLDLATAETVRDLEVWWIAYGRASGWRLCNRTDGGAGTLKFHPESRARMSERATAQFRKQDQRELRRQMMFSRQSPEWSEYLRAKTTARYNSPEAVAQRERRLAERAAQSAARKVENLERTREVLSKRARERQADPEVRRRIGERTKSYWADPEKRERMLAAVRSPWTDERRASVAAKARARQADPEVKKAIADRVRAYRARVRKEKENALSALKP